MKPYGTQPKIVEVRNTRSGGIGFVGLLTLIFVIAKITGHITWSWWLVFSPILVVLGIWAFFTLVFTLIAAIVLSKS